jgi:hypothetical protein
MSDATDPQPQPEPERITPTEGALRVKEAMFNVVQLVGQMNGTLERQRLRRRFEGLAAALWSLAGANNLNVRTPMVPDPADDRDAIVRATEWFEKAVELARFLVTPDMHPALTAVAGVLRGRLAALAATVGVAETARPEEEETVSIPGSLAAATASPAQPKP